MLLNISKNICRRWLAVTLIVTFALTPLQVIAETGVNGMNGQPITGNSLTWTNFLSQIEAYKTATDNVTVTVNGDLTAASTVKIPSNAYGKTLTITGGGKITRSASATGSLFTVASGTSLTLENITIDGGKKNGVSGGGSLMNVSGVLKMNNGAILQNNGTPSNGGGVYVNTNGSFSMSGGEISGNSAYCGGGIYFSSNDSFNMSGGEIRDNSSSYGGGVYVSGNDSFNMRGGEISNNSSNYGGGVYVSSNGSLNMSGGEISGNSTSSYGGGIYVNGSFNIRGGEISNNSANYGGGVYVSSNGGSLNMSGGEIKDNFSDYGGGVFVNGTIALGGDAVVKNNTARDKSTLSNVYLKSDKYITLNNATDDIMEIWVQTQTPSGVIVKDGAIESDANHFKSDIKEKFISFKDGKLIAVNSPTWANFLSQIEAYKTATDDVTITVNGDLTAASTVKIPSNAYGKTLTITGGGKITRSASATGDLFTVASGTSLTLENITIDGGKENGVDGIGSLVYVSGILKMNNGAILQNNSTTSGGGVLVDSNGSFNMSGGEISGNSASSYGGGVFVGGAITLGGDAVIKNNTTRGKVNLSNVYLKSDKYITLNAAGNEMEIWVQTQTPSGIIVESGAMPSDAEHFKSDIDEKAVSFDNGKLIISSLMTWDKFLREVESYKTAVNDVTIIVHGNLTAKCAVKIPANVRGKTLTITGNGKITRGTTASGELFTVVNGANLILDNITIDGGIGGKGSLIEVLGTLKMNDGAILQNNNATLGSGVNVKNGGRFTMSGGKISGNSASVYGGGGVYVNSNGFFTMNGGEISGNSAATYGGGGVYVNKNGIFTMSGGKIINNSATLNQGGGVYCGNNGSFTMTGGEIGGNSAISGGGMFAVASGAITLGGNAIIKGNTALDLTTKSNICLRNKTYITLADRGVQMEIWVQTETTSGIIVESGALPTDTMYFKSDTDGKIIAYRSENNGQLIIE